MSLPRPLIEQDWFRTVATYNPVSYLIEGIRSFIITGWDARRSRSASASPIVVAVGGFGAASAPSGRGWCGHEAPREVARAVAWRSIHNIITTPAYCCRR